MTTKRTTTKKPARPFRRGDLVRVLRCPPGARLFPGRTAKARAELAALEGKGEAGKTESKETT